MNVQPDHVHLLIQIPPRQSVSRVVQRLKGGSSRMIREEFPGLEEFLWGGHLWGEGFFAETVGQIEEATLRRYIQNQREPQTQ